MNAEMLSVTEVAGLMNMSERHIRRLINDNKLEYKLTVNINNRPTYKIPFDALDSSAQQKYMNSKRKEIEASMPMLPVMADVVEKPKGFDLYTEAERLEIIYWQELLDEWQEVRSDPRHHKNKTQVDVDFVAMQRLKNPDKELSVDTLYRRLNALKKGDYDGLIDKRRYNRKGQSRVNSIMFEAFLYYYLDEAQHPLTLCYKYMSKAIKEVHPHLYTDIPHMSSFRRKLINDLPEHIKILGREGEKAYRDHAGLYIRREYESMESNDYWIADTHTIDVQSMSEDGRVHRLYLSAFMDARSGVMVGWHISESPSSQTTLLALRDAILRRGAVPRNIYVDNGREFLTHDIGGLGHRRRKTKDSETYEVPPIFKRLGINMVNAIVKNARAKTIERRFGDFKNQISRLFATYTGGNVLERPEILKTRIKNGNIVLDTVLIQEVDMIIEHYFNRQPYGGAVKADRGKDRLQVYNDNFGITRKATADELHLLLMRSSRVQTFGRRGVKLTINGEQYDFWSEDARDVLFNKKVYFRYNPMDISSVRLYDLEDRFIMTVPCTDETVCSYGAGKDEIANAQKIVRRVERADKDKIKDIKSLGYRTSLEIVGAIARENAENPVVAANPKVVEMVRANEEPAENMEYLKAAGAELDFAYMVENAQRRRAEEDGYYEDL